MPKALFLIVWDDFYGSKVEAQYPKEADIGEDELTQYLMALQVLSTSPVVRVVDDKRTVLVFGIQAGEDATRSNYNYDLLVLFLDEDEAPAVRDYQVKLEIAGPGILQARGEVRWEKFEQLAADLFKPPVQKVVFIGYPNSGKTTTKKYLFEHASAEGLLSTSLAPTVGFETSLYQFLDLSISMFDASGQELGRWMSGEGEVFAGSDLTVFFFSVEDWRANRAEILGHLEKLHGKVESAPGEWGKVVVFCHKFDLVPPGEGVSFRTEVTTAIGDLGFPVFFTSIADGGNQDLVLGMQLLLEYFSPVFSAIVQFTESIEEQYSASPMFLLGSDARVVVDFSRPDASPAGPPGDLQKIEKYCRIVVGEYRAEFGEPPGFISFRVGGTGGGYHVVLVDVSAIHPSFSYLAFRAGSLSGLDKFLDELASRLETSKWPGFSVPSRS
ncbi:MAG: GTPase domain-containing protein [Promethearchaeota archaeon]